MKYRTIEGGYKVPVFTKDWKAMWFMLGMFFQIFAPFFAVIYYAIRFPQIKTVREVAATWATTRLVHDGRHPSMCRLHPLFTKLITPSGGETYV